MVFWAAYCDGHCNADAEGWQQYWADFWYTPSEWLRWWSSSEGRLAIGYGPNDAEDLGPIRVTGKKPTGAA